MGDKKEQWAKAEGQFRLQLNGVLAPFYMYGKNTRVDGQKIDTAIEAAADAILRLAKQYHIRMDYIGGHRRTDSPIKAG